MRFQPWRKTERRTPGPATSGDEPEPLSPGDLERWANGESATSTEGADHRVEALRDRLLAVLADDEASMVPASAGDMTQQEWDELTEAQRESFRQLQLKRVDPRYVPTFTMAARRSGSRSSRVYR